jgi:hypothetical protein
MLNCVCQLYKKVYIVVDALDECSSAHDHRPTFLKHIIDLQVEHEANIFATSRPIPEITEVFEKSSSLRISAQSEDVGKYVDGYMPRLRSFVRQRPDLQAEIKRKIVEVVDGMYVYYSSVAFLCSFFASLDFPMLISSFVSGSC